MDTCRTLHSCRSWHFFTPPPFLLALSLSFLFLFFSVQLTERLDAAGCKPLPEEDYPRSLVGVLPAGKRVKLRVDVPNKHDENSAGVAYFQVGVFVCVGVWVSHYFADRDRPHRAADERYHDEKRQRFCQTASQRRGVLWCSCVFCVFMCLAICCSVCS